MFGVELEGLAVEGDPVGAPVGARVLVIGDASLIRDDFLTGPRPMMGLTRSIGGLNLFNNALDWMALDTDLVELRNSKQVDRSLEFIAPDPNGKETPEERRRRIGSKKQFLRWLNILAPMVLLMGFGCVLWSKRSAEKRGFLTSAGR